MIRTFDLRAGIETELARVEQALHDWTDSRVPAVAAIADEMLQAGGKRVRPALVILASRACGATGASERLVNVACSVELMHMASLIHDDVVDRADTRRGRPAANATWGNHKAVLSGDYLWAVATSVLANDGDTEVIRVLSDTSIKMIEGVVSELVSDDGDDLMDRCLEITRLKTAELMGACCEVGGIVAGEGWAVREPLSDYGRSLGMAYQITDDLLDLTGDPDTLGKPVGGDLREGKITLPIVFTLQSVNGRDRERLTSILDDGQIEDTDLQFALDLVCDCGAADRCRSLASDYIERAERALSSLPPSLARDQLQELDRFILSRDH